MKSNFQTTAALTLVLLVTSGVSHGALLSFDLDYSGSATGNSAQAHASLTVDDTYFPGSSPLTFLYPGVEIVDFRITVTHASSGNGTFLLADYDSFGWGTAGASLNLGQELVGQPTPGGTWAGTHDGSTGDFSPFTSLSLLTSAPTGAGNPFQIITNNGTGDVLNLVSFHPAAVVPVPASLWLMLSALAGFSARWRSKSAA